MGKRIRRKKTALFAGLLAAALMLVACSGGQNPGNSSGQTGEGSGNGTAQPEQVQTGSQDGIMGRYMESEVWKADNDPVYDLYARDGEIFVVKDVEKDVKIDLDTGVADRHLGDKGWRAYRKIRGSHAVSSLAVADNGARMVTYYSLEDGESDGAGWRYVHQFISSEGELSEWSDYLGKQDGNSIWYGRNGYFYVVGYRTPKSGQAEDVVSALYRISTETGETDYLWDVPGVVNYLAFSGDYLFVLTNLGLKIYSLSSGEQLPEDKVLSGLLENLSAYENSIYDRSFLIAPSGQEEGIYVLTRDGIYRHVMYGTVAERMIDGALCSISDSANQFQALWAWEEAEGLPVFFLAYGDGSVRRFDFDENMAAVPDKVLRVYSLYHDENVRQAVSAYRAANPGFYVQYEVGIQEGSSLTREDALKNLATRLAAGDGPDVLVMDGLPYESYVEKGVLTDLSALPVMTEGAYYEKIYQNYYRGEQLYAVPMSFQVLVLAGEKESIAEVSGMADLADLLEASVKSGSMGLGLVKEENIMEMFGRLSCGSWTGENGDLDREAVGEFLTLCRRIYLADRAGLNAGELDEVLGRNSGEVIHDWYGLGQLDSRWYVGNRVIDNQTGGDQVPYAVGYLGADTMRGLQYLQGLLDLYGMDYKPLPVEGSCGVPSSLLAINQSTRCLEEAEAFVAYALSEEFQKGTVLDGVPVNRTAAIGMEVNPYEDLFGSEPYNEIGVGAAGGEQLAVPLVWSNQEQLEKWNGILKAAQGVGYCDQMVYETVMELGKSAVNGEKGIEETVEGIAKKVQLHLAE